MQQSVTMHQQRQEQKDYKLTNMEENDAMQRNCKKKKLFVEGKTLRIIDI